ncbi:hypothetical protein [Paenibacillus spongiae]|uniref:Uncharacterized protein n=1 Tax=Paenibacillus spongiae TaxID=2909671 RepID=A0ABY5S6K5_9BACL|nr:hypothetical protein [Paenibacillus spongiae]UVI28185.1 hypothetical protein L1F29_22370 [Paenibacillus spongiae]
MTQFEKNHAFIQKVIKNCSVEIEIVALTEDKRFAGMHGGVLKAFVVSQYCNAAYTWCSSAGSIMDRGVISNLSEAYRFVEEVIGGQLEMQF